MLNTVQIIAEYAIGGVCILGRASSEDNALPKIVEILSNVRR
jgi:hypothetical protein